MRYFRALSFAVLCSSLLLPSSTFAATAKAQTVHFLNHIEYGLPIQDAFVVRGLDDGNVYRPSQKDSLSSLYGALYGTTVAVAQDLTGVTDGPFPKGQIIVSSLHRWLDASGDVTTRCTTSGYEVVTAKFTSLLKNNWYSLQVATLTKDHGRVTGLSTAPLGAADGRQSLFKTSSVTGNATIGRTFKGCLPKTALDQNGTGTETQIWAVFHSDKKTHGASVGDWGVNAHMQLVAPLL